MRTFIATTSEGLEARKWWVVDAQGQPLGRLASRVANILRGKHKPTFTPHIDCGDFVIVVNAANVKMTGQKADRKLYYRHSGFPGGLRTESFRHLIERNPPAPIELAVKGMLPRSKLGRQLLRKLKVYATAQHPHAAQQPQTLSW